MSHYHVMGVCREHGAQELSVEQTLEDAKEYIFKTIPEKFPERFQSVYVTGQTDNMLEFDVVDVEGGHHSMFASWGIHSDPEVSFTDCRELFEARRMLQMMQEAVQGMRALDAAANSPEPAPEPESEFNFDSLMSEIDTFLNNQNPGV